MNAAFWAERSWAMVEKARAGVSYYYGQRRGAYERDGESWMLAAYWTLEETGWSNDIHYP
jgi:hypothetical protein